MNVLSEPTLAVSVGHRPANSRPAHPTREYEPGSGESHDPAPVHRPHPPRSPPADHRCRGEPANHTGPPLQPQDLASPAAATAALRAGLDPGASAAPGAGNAGRPGPAPGAGRLTPHLTRAQPGTIARPGPEIRRLPTGSSDPVNQDTTASTGVAVPPDEVQKLDRPFHMNIRRGRPPARLRQGDRGRRGSS